MARGLSLLIVLFCFLGQVSLYSQTCLGVPDGMAGKGKVNLIPFGGKGPSGPFQNVRYQVRIPASSLPGGKGELATIEFAPPQPASYNFKYLKVSAAHAKGKSMNALFSANMSSPVTLLEKHDWKWSFSKGNEWTAVSMDNSFIWDGIRDIVIEIITQESSCSSKEIGFRRSSSLECVYLLGYDIHNPAKSGYGPLKSGLKVRLCFGKGGGKITLFGKGCKSSAGFEPTISASSPPSQGKNFKVSSFHAPGGAAGLLFIGNSIKIMGTLKLPFDLSAIGAPTCKLYTNILFNFSVQASASGAAFANVPIPTGTALKGLSIHLQWLFVDKKANTAGLVFSSGGTAKIR